MFFFCLFKGKSICLRKWICKGKWICKVYFNALVRSYFPLLYNGPFITETPSVLFRIATFHYFSLLYQSYNVSVNCFMFLLCLVAEMWYTNKHCWSSVCCRLCVCMFNYTIKLFLNKWVICLFFSFEGKD